MKLRRVAAIGRRSKSGFCPLCGVRPGMGLWLAFSRMDGCRPCRMDILSRGELFGGHEGGHRVMESLRRCYSDQQIEAVARHFRFVLPDA